MGKDTPIEWCDSAVNPVMGCDGCELWIPEKGIEHCYAGTLHKIRAGRPGYADRFDVPKMFPGRMTAAGRWSDLTGRARPDKPWLDGMPRMIFVSNMGDALSRSVPFEYLQAEIIEAARSEAGQSHLWLWLTKQPQRMAQLALQIGEWPKNLWAGTSVTSSEQTARRQRASNTYCECLLRCVLSLMSRRWGRWISVHGCANRGAVITAASQRWDCPQEAASIADCRN